MRNDSAASARHRNVAPILVVVGTLVLCLSIVITLVGARHVLRGLTASPLKKALPATARDVREWNWNEGGPTGQDYLYLLRAKISEQEFQSYIVELGMTAHSPSRQYQHGFYPNWYPAALHVAEHVDWWTPTESAKHTYVLDGSTWWSYAKYENGYVYVVSLNL